MSVYNDRLQTLAQRAQQLMADSDELDESTWDLAYLTVLAALFDYEVNNGGFGQLIFNVGNQAEEGLLEQLDGMLRTVNAPVALSFYVRAATRCAENLDDYHDFLTDITAPTELGQDLTMVSIEYLRGETGFADEIAEFLDYAEARL
ncbi:DMP19 family protein [Nocardia sp. CA-290969]|uniref:DMP19 family protein n=1 Tax=Nocardia sp. CA-290969 TaxID=3239986 RepID=UPI003D8A91E1